VFRDAKKAIHKAVAGTLGSLETLGTDFNTIPKKMAFTLRTGFLQANSAASGTITPQHVGHVFGRMGQGDRTTAFELDVQAPFIWNTVAQGEKTGMMISLLPVTASSTGLAEEQFVYINATLMDWQDHSLLTTPPSAPTAAVPPTALGSKWLKSTTLLLAATSSLCLSLY